MDINYLKAKAEQAGNHFFDKGAMRFFNSRVLPSSFTKMDEGVYRFVTSERCDNEARFYTIREVTLDPFDIVDVSEFQEYATGREAMKHIKEN